MSSKRPIRWQHFSCKSYLMRWSLGIEVKQFTLNFNLTNGNIRAILNVLKIAVSSFKIPEGRSGRVVKLGSKTGSCKWSFTGTEKPIGVWKELEVELGSRSCWYSSIINPYTHGLFNPGSATATYTSPIKFYFSKVWYLK